MILTVTPNAALDVSYIVDNLSHSEPVRVRQVTMRPGGKGVNVAFVLACLGSPVAVSGFAGGHRGQLIRDGLVGSGIADALTTMASESRQTVVAVADDGDFAEYDEPGGVVTANEWETFFSDYRRLLETCSVVVCAGSLPPGLPDDAYALLIAAARDHGRSIVLDSSGEALRHGLDARPDVLKLNLAELEGLAGKRFADERSVVDWADRLDGTVIVTLGAEGAIAAGDGWRYRMRPPQRKGNPVGAGDAFTAGFVSDEVSTAAPDRRLAFAAALAASSVGLTGAGVVDLDLAKHLLDDVKVEAL